MPGAASCRTVPTVRNPHAVWSERPQGDLHPLLERRVRDVCARRSSLSRRFQAELEYAKPRDHVLLTCEFRARFASASLLPLASAFSFARAALQPSLSARCCACSRLPRMKSAPYVRSASNRVCAARSRTHRHGRAPARPTGPGGRIRVARGRIAALATGAHERALAASRSHTARFTSKGCSAVLAAPALAGTRDLPTSAFLQLTRHHGHDRLRTSATSPAGTGVTSTTDVTQQPARLPVHVHCSVNRPAERARASRAPEWFRPNARFSNSRGYLLGPDPVRRRRDLELAIRREGRPLSQVRPWEALGEQQH